MSNTNAAQAQATTPFARGQQTQTDKSDFQRLLEKPNEKAVEFVPFGASDKIKLTVEIVQKFICTPTAKGQTCSTRDAVRFIMMCQAKRLNPFESDAYIVGYDGKDGPVFSLITAHQAFLKRAEVHQEYDGMESGIVILTDGGPVDIEGDFHLPEEVVVGGWARIHFKNRKHPIYRRLRLARFNKGRSVWNDDAAGMICKCFDDETEVLTTRGFERFAIAEGQILQVTESGLVPTDAVPFFQPYTGEMIEYKSRNGNFRVSPNHDLPLAINGEMETAIEARHLFDMRQRDDVIMPLCGVFSGQDFPIGDHALRLAAAYIADGSDNSGSAGFTISVSRPDKIASLRALGMHTSEKRRSDAGSEAVASSGRVITTTSDKQAFYYSRSWELDWLVARGKQIDSNALLALSPRQAKLFVDAWLGMDGHKPDSCRIGRIYTSRPDHCAAIEIAANLAGYSVSERKGRQSDIGGVNWSLTLTNRRSVNLSRQLIERSQNASGVWCVKVPSGKIVVRRHGFSCISHNCAEADALRSAFPTMLGGLYMAGEIQFDVTASDIRNSAAVERDPSKLFKVIEAPKPKEPEQAKDTAEEAQAGLAPAQPAEVVTEKTEPAKVRLEKLVTSNGFTFSHFQYWANEGGVIANADALTGFDDVKDADADRLLKMKPATILGHLRAAKEARG